MKKIFPLFLLLFFLGTHAYSQPVVILNCIKNFCRIDESVRIVFEDSPNVFKNNLPDPMNKEELVMLEVEDSSILLVIDTLFRDTDKLIKVREIGALSWLLITRQVHGYRGRLSLTEPNFFPIKTERKEPLVNDLLLVQWDKNEKIWCLRIIPHLDLGIEMKEYKSARIFYLNLK